MDLWNWRLVWLKKHEYDNIVVPMIDGELKIIDYDVSIEVSKLF